MNRREVKNIEISSIDELEEDVIDYMRDTYMIRKRVSYGNDPINFSKRSFYGVLEFFSEDFPSLRSKIASYYNVGEEEIHNILLFNYKNVPFISFEKEDVEESCSREKSIEKNINRDIRVVTKIYYATFSRRDLIHIKKRIIKAETISTLTPAEVFEINYSKYDGYGIIKNLDEFHEYIESGYEYSFWKEAKIIQIFIDLGTSLDFIDSFIESIETRRDYEDMLNLIEQFPNRSALMLLLKKRFSKN